MNTTPSQDEGGGVQEKSSSHISAVGAGKTGNEKKKNANRKKQPTSELIRRGWFVWLSEGSLFVRTIKALGSLIILGATVYGVYIGYQVWKSGDRAIVGITFKDIDFIKGTVPIALSNTGKLPGAGVKIKIREYRTLPGDIVRGHGELLSTGRSLVPPGIETYKEKCRLANFHPEEEALLKEEKAKMIVAGTVEYEDGVGGNPSFGFCYVYDYATAGHSWLACGVVRGPEEAIKGFQEMDRTRQQYYSQ